MVKGAVETRSQADQHECLKAEITVITWKAAENQSQTLISSHDSKPSFNDVYN